MKKYTAILLAIVFAGIWCLAFSAAATQSDNTKPTLTLPPRQTTPKPPVTYTMPPTTTKPGVTGPTTTARSNLGSAIDAVQNGNGDYVDIINGVANGINDIGGAIGGGLNIIVDGAGKVNYDEIFAKLGTMFEQPSNVATTTAGGEGNKPATTVPQQSGETVTNAAAAAIGNTLNNVIGNIGSSNGLLSGLFGAVSQPAGNIPQTTNRDGTVATQVNPANNPASSSEGISGGLASILSGLNANINNATGGSSDSSSIIGALGSLGSLGTIGGQNQQTTIPPVTSANITINTGSNAGVSYTYNIIGNITVPAAPASPSVETVTTQLYTLPTTDEPATRLVPVNGDGIVSIPGGVDNEIGLENEKKTTTKKIIGAVIVVMAFGAIAAVVIKRAM